MLREKELFSSSRQDRDPEKTQGILVEDSCFDWEIKETDSRSFIIKIEEECVLKYEDGVFSLSFEGAMGAGRKVRKALVPKLYSIRILADTSLMEIYLNEGEYVFTSRYYTESEMDTKLKAKAATSHTHNAIKMKTATSTISFDWVLVSGVWKLQVFVDGTLVRTL